MNITVGLKALFAVQAVIPGAILAGGYLRDSILGRPAKDIDIFIPSMGVNLGHLAESLEGIGAKLQLDASAYMEQTEVDAVLSLPGFELPVQIIELAPGLEPIERAKAHDFGICQVWHTGTELGATEAFTRDASDQTFTLMGVMSGKDYDRSMRRWGRLGQKYPEFTLVDKAVVA